MIDGWRAVPMLLRIGFREAVAYRAELVVWILTSTMPVVMLAMWFAASADGPIGEFSQDDFVAYYAATFVSRQLVSSWVAWELARAIKVGTLSLRLVRPAHPLLMYAAENLAPKPMQLLLVLPVLPFVAWWRPGVTFAVDAASVALFLAAVSAGWLVNFLVQWIIGTLSFWTTESAGIVDAWIGVWSLLSGYLIPIALFPGALRSVLVYLPFHAFAGLPAEILAGKVGHVDALLRIGAAWAWVAAIAALAALVWRAGLRRFAAVGG